MIGVSRRTFSDLVDDVMGWAGMADDAGELRTRAKSAVAASHERRLLDGRWSFMLYPTPQTVTMVAGQQNYSLNEAFLTPQYFRSRTTGNPVIPVPYDKMLTHLPTSGTTGYVNKVMLHGVSKVQNQPTSASVITPSSSSGSDNGRTVTVTGETETGIQSETLTLPTAGSVEFINILDVTKGAGTWYGTLTLTANAGAVTVLKLGAAQYGRQFPQMRSLIIPNTAEVIEYNFFRLPKLLSADNDIPDTPYPFDRLHVLDANLALQDFSRPTASTVRQWEQERAILEGDMAATYQDGLADGSEASYITLVSRD